MISVNNGFKKIRHGQPTVIRKQTTNVCDHNEERVILDLICNKVMKKCKQYCSPLPVGTLVVIANKFIGLSAK